MLGVTGFRKSRWISQVYPGNSNQGIPHFTWYAGRVPSPKTLTSATLLGHQSATLKLLEKIESSFFSWNKTFALPTPLPRP